MRVGLGWDGCPNLSEQTKSYFLNYEDKDEGERKGG